ncbi:hypothetical protein [Streptomyces sp. NPDC046685]|uniref:hypothetical protein n=1 Tax=Streptomyces sp. NPDC046685 TaxID=3157202 RepID=UPI0033CA5A9C
MIGDVGGRPPTQAKSGPVKADIIVVDTPAFMLPKAEDDEDESIAPLGDETTGDALLAVLDVADDVIVPLEAEGSALTPTRVTVERVLTPRQIPTAS